MSGFFDFFTLKHLTKKQEMPHPETEKLLEVNLGCFGGFDSQALATCWQNAYANFLEYLKKTNPNKYIQVTEFWGNLGAATVPETRNLFSNSLDNLVEIISKQMGEFETFKKFLLISVGKEFEKKGEENYFLLNAVVDKLKFKNKENYKPGAGITILDFLGILKEAESKNSDMKLLENIFMFDDFTDEELKYEIEKSERKEKYEQQEINFLWAKKQVEKVASLYPRNLEQKAGRDFAKILKQQKNNSPLLVEPIYGQNVLVYENKNLQSDKKKHTVEVYDGKKKIDLNGKVLKIDGTSSGEGIYFYQKAENNVHKKASVKTEAKYFNEYTLQTLTEGKKYTIEDYVHGPKILIPYDLKNKKYGKMKEYVVDVRFGYFFDPKKPNKVQVISSYGRFNYPGEKSNIAQGGGVVEIAVVKDENYQAIKNNMLAMIFNLEKQDGKYFQEKFDQELENQNITYKGKPLPMSPLPFIISQSAFERMKISALQVAKNLNSQHPFIFALDAFLDPNPKK